MPEFTKEQSKDIVASDNFRKKMIPRAEFIVSDNHPLWHGWVIMDAFLAGIEYQKNKEDIE